MLLQPRLPRPGSPAQSIPDSSETHPRIAGYRIGDPMGVGPLGTIYRAQDETTGAIVVFRGFSKPEGADDGHWRKAEQQFSDLLTAHRSIPDHPNVQKILKFGVDDELFWIAAERIEGVNLQTVLERFGGQSLVWAIAVLKQIAAAVDWSCEHGLTHSDLTPYNVLIVTGDLDLVQGVPLADVVKIKVINFGMAHARPKYGSSYAAPEQMDGYEGDRQSDVYAAGALLYTILAGSPPFGGATADDIARRVRSNTPPPLTNRAPYVGQILARMLEKDPRRRYASVKEAVDDLESGRAPSASAIGTPFPASPTVANMTPSLQPDASTSDRFARLELDTSPSTQAVTGPGATSMAFPSAEDAYLATKASHIALQQYRLNDQNLVEIRSRLERQREEKAHRMVGGRRRALRFTVASAVVLGAICILMQAGAVPGRYRTATVLGKTGDVYVEHDGQKTALRPGDEVPLVAGSGDSDASFLTSPGGRLLLDIAGTRLHLRESSALAVRQIDYNGGPIRRFELLRGSIVAKVDPIHRADAVFEINSQGVRAVATGTLFGVIRQQNRTRETVIIAVNEGTVRVVDGEARTNVPAGHQVSIRQGTEVDAPHMSPTDHVSASVKADILRSGDAINSVSQDSAFGTFVFHSEEIAVLPALEFARTAFHIRSYLADRAAQLKAVGSMQALCGVMKAVALVPGSGRPDTINLKTLDGLGLGAEETDRILAQFQNKTLLSYQPLPGGGYEFLAQAYDSRHSLVRGRNGSATLVGNDDTDIPNTGAATAAPKQSN